MCSITLRKLSILLRSIERVGLYALVAWNSSAQGVLVQVTGGSISLRGVRGVFDGLQHGMDYVIGLGCEDIFCLLIYKTMN